MGEPTVVVVGASARAAAFAALRAGLRPWALDLFADRDLCAACPARRLEEPRPPGRWLVKPVAGAGGAGIRRVRSPRSYRRPVYVQEFIVGESRSAVFVADAGGCRLLGVTRQLVGEPWLHAPAFG